MEEQKGKEEMWWGLNLLAETACFVAEDDGFFDRELKSLHEKENRLERVKDSLSGAGLDVSAQESVAPKERGMMMAMELTRAPKKARSDGKRRPNPKIPLLLGVECQRRSKGLKRHRLECNSNAEKEARKMKKQNQITTTIFPIPVDFNKAIQLMGGTNIALVIQKRLYATDLNPNHGRLSIPSNQLSGAEFLTPEEKDQLDKKIYMEVLLLEPCLDKTTLQFGKWNMTTSFTYNLLTSWNLVASKKRNRLNVGGLVQLYSFRLQSRLCFALVNVEETQKLISNHHDAFECAASSLTSSAIAHELH